MDGIHYYSRTGNNCKFLINVNYETFVCLQTLKHV